MCCIYLCTVCAVFFPPTLDLTTWSNVRVIILLIQMRLVKKCHSAIFAPCPTFSSSASLWYQCEVPPTRHSLVTAYLQRSQAWASGTAPRSRLGDWGVSQETQHKYGDPNNVITNGAIRPRILESYPREDAFVWGRGNWGVGGQWRCLDNNSYVLC